jgi:hypothetical protein
MINIWLNLATLVYRWLSLKILLMSLVVMQMVERAQGMHLFAYFKTSYIYI